MKIFFLLAMVTLFPTTGSAQINSFHWEKIDHSPFIIHYLEGDHYSAGLVKNRLDFAYPRLQDEFQYQLTQPVYLYLCNSFDSYRQVVGKNVPLWSAGLAYPNRNLIILKTVASENNYLNTAVHELTHIITHKMTKGNKLPRWLDEGLAVYFSNEKEFASSSLISKALISNSIIPLSDIDHVLSFNPAQAQLAYQESYVAVIYLHKKYGKNSVRAILNRIGQGDSIDKAFIHSIGMDSWDFELLWYNYIQKKYKWHFLVDFEFYLWIFILLLFIFGFILIRYRNKKKIREWEEEDYLYDDYWGDFDSDPDFSSDDDYN